MYNNGVPKLAVERLAPVFRILQDPVSYFCPQAGHIGGVLFTSSDTPGKFRSARKIGDRIVYTVLRRITTFRSTTDCIYESGPIIL